MTYDPNFPDTVPASEEAASASTLDLAPWVEEQARPLRQAHMEERIAESNASTISKWKRRVCLPRGGSHKH